MKQSDNQKILETYKELWKSSSSKPYNQFKFDLEFEKNIFVGKSLEVAHFIEFVSLFLCCDFDLQFVSRLISTMSMCYIFYRNYINLVKFNELNLGSLSMIRLLV